MIDDCRLVEVAALHQFLVSDVIFANFFAIKNTKFIIKRLRVKTK